MSCAERGGKLTLDVRGSWVGQAGLAVAVSGEPGLLAVELLAFVASGDIGGQILAKE